MVRLLRSAPILQAPPKPTANQLLYHRMEVGALISFNMATAAGSQGCGPGAYPPASVFNSRVPPAANTDQVQLWQPVAARLRFCHHTG